MTCARWHHVEILHFCSASRKPRSVMPPLSLSKGRKVFITSPVHDQYCRGPVLLGVAAEIAPTDTVDFDELQSLFEEYGFPVTIFDGVDDSDDAE